MKKYHGYLKPWEVSKYLGIPLEEVQKMIETKELPSTKIGDETRVPWDQLEAWLDEEVDEDKLTQLSQHLDDVDEADVKSFVDPKAKTEPKE